MSSGDEAPRDQAGEPRSPGFAPRERLFATFLRGGVKQRYSDRSEKLVELGLAPFRAKTKAKAADPKPPATPPPSPTPHPTTA